ncbi:hypothetical protein GCM10009007_18880 [Formosimonas limnophila]|uniref:Uncharacterized protein n=1 Tax=Formosimonas limnophila TaxID=1384487 RepID=A0A8J3G0D3_9BURK|nr:hypothetical protein [Formosimonas limnophila]GHA78159.1 hypothetical protein GCM10009007_18880 [Formosimonas limnophila]
MVTAAPTTNALRPLITQAGLASAVGLNGQSVQVNITHISYGTGQYTPTGQETALRSEKIRVPIAGGTKVSPTAHQVYAAGLRAPAGAPWFAYEVGFWAGDVLFAVYANVSAPVIYISDTVDVVGAYLLGTSALPNDAISVVVDPNAASVFNILAQLPLVRYDLQALSPVQQTQVQKNLGLDQLFAKFSDVGANNNLLTNGGMDIWQENTNFNIPKVTLPYTADCFVVHGGRATDTGGINVVMARWPTSPSHYGAVSHGIDDDLPRGVDRFMACYRGGAGLVSIQNRSLQNYYTYAGRRVVFSLYARIAGYNGQAYNVTDHLPEEGPTLPCQLGVQRVVSQTGSGSIIKTAEITPYWKRIYVVLDIPAPDEVNFPLSIPKERSYAGMFFQVNSAASIEIHTTAWKVEDCLYPSDFPIENIKPSPWLPKPFSAELMECQRYYCKSYPTYVPVGTPFTDHFQASGFKRTMNDMGDQMINTISTQFPIEMISKPAITIYNAVSGTANNAGLVTSAANPTFAVAGIEWGVKGIHSIHFNGYTSNIALEFHYSANARL